MTNGLSQDAQDFLRDLTGSAPEPTSELDTTETDHTATEETDTPEGTETDEGTPENTEQTPAKPDPEALVNKFTEAKDNKAFAAMRVQNKAMQRTFENLAKSLNIDTSNMTPEDLANNVNDMVLELQAKNSNIPADILKEMDEFKGMKQEAALQQRRYDVANALIKVQETYGLDDVAMDAFCKGLNDKGLNPLTQDLDLEAIYLKENFKTVVTKQVEAAVAAERERAAKATNQGTTPTKAQGGAPDVGDSKISTVADLDKLFNEL